jgi:hypothetical protein
MRLSVYKKPAATWAAAAISSAKSFGAPVIRPMLAFPGGESKKKIDSDRPGLYPWISPVLYLSLIRPCS